MHNLKAQFITLKGKQFIDASGQPFYPVVCNYSVNVVCNSCTCNYGDACSSSDYSVYPNANYGTTTHYEASSGHGLDYIKADFMKIKSMGFNTIRLFGLSFEENMHTGNPSTYRVSPGPGGSIICYKYSSPAANGYWGQAMQVFSPYSTDANIQNILLPIINQVLDAAHAANINIILLCGGHYVSGGGTYLGDTYNDVDQANDYAEYLSVMATNLATRPEIFAYDLYNEPGYAMYTTYGSMTANAKNKICTFTAQWYDAIKGQDANHLVTMGNISEGDVFNYDPAIMKLDFNTLHPYPWYYWTLYDSYNRTNALNRMQAGLTWMTNNCPMPWIITETAISAWAATSPQYGQNTNTTLLSGLPDPTYSNNWISANITEPPFLYGTLQDQADYAIQTQQIVLNSGGSGYGWWDFQDNAWDIGTSVADMYTPANNGYKEYFSGLLAAGDATYSGGVYTYTTDPAKPVVAQAFSTNTQTHATAQVNLPAYYYNAWGGAYFTFSGVVQDQDGNPIQDAIIQGQNGAQHIGINSPPPASGPEVPDNVNFTIETFSKADGTFNLIAPISSPSSTSLANGNYDYGKFDRIQVSAPGANVFTWANPEGISATSPSSTIITLNRKARVFDAPTDLSFVDASNSPTTFTARHGLEVFGDIISTDGTADFHASSIVNVPGVTIFSTPGFEAEKGSYTHIYCLPVDFDCSKLLSPDYIHRLPGTVNNMDTTTAFVEKDIIVNYLLPANNIRLLPNPANNYFYVLAPGDSPACMVEITDAFGNGMYAGKALADGQTPFNTSNFAPGLYTVHVANNSENQIFKLIISR